MTPPRTLRLLTISLACLGAAALALGAPDESDLAAQLAAARDAGHWSDVGELARQLVAINPQKWEYQRGLAESLFHAGQYSDALAPYARAIELAPAPADPKAKAALGGMLIDEGDCYMKSGKFNEAVAAYDKAAPLSPEPGNVYFNICMAEFVRRNWDQAIAYAEKTIKADPAHADAYYVKGSLLAKKGTNDPDTGRFVVPDGTIEALNKYLELKPGGSHADAVRDMLRLFQQQ